MKRTVFGVSEITREIDLDRVEFTVYPTFFSQVYGSFEFNGLLHVTNSVPEGIMVVAEHTLATFPLPTEAPKI